MSALDDWIAAEAQYATQTMLGAISATHLVMERPGFGQRVIPRPGSILASPVPAHYDPDPDYFFHWFRDSAIVIEALRVALITGYTDRSVLTRLREFLQFSRALHSLNGAEFLRRTDFRARVQPDFLQYLRPDAEIAALSGAGVLADVRVNADATLDFIRWGRPQTDGPALRAITLLRWRQQFPELCQDATLRADLSEVIRADLAFVLAFVPRPSNDLWEEESAYHYYTQLVQAQALIMGAAWLEETGQHARAQQGQAAAAEALSRLDLFWSDSNGLYRSRTAQEPVAARKDPDIAVVLAVLHAARAGGRHSVLDPKAQATLTALEELFEAEFAINRERPAGRGPALGRYANDRYYGGGAWYLATLAAAEFYFRLAAALGSGARMPVTPENLRFRQRLGPDAPVGGDGSLMRLALERGDAIMRTVQAFTPADGELSEQFDPTSGAQTSAKHLSWSYAAFITAAACRAQACHSMKAAGRATNPAGSA
ncbi:MAG TPA: glycoside hydrolase family 15 protein [Steroidobacteraceae bacterium]|nr:glycoside hydrolase family 15 protein [Steroidobacteraceae bacterium]